MALSNDLVTQFVKITNDDTKNKTESTVYGTAVEYNGSIYVRLDGSDLLTPISTTTDVKAGERVTVMIKNHTATVTGNISSPSARTDDVKELNAKTEDLTDEISEFEIIIADKATVSELEVEKARIDDLTADNVTIKNTLTANKADISDLQADNITITETLTANQADIENLKTTKLDASIADITYATIENLEATNAEIYNLEAVYGDFEILTTNRFDAIDATIKNLDATYATITDLETERARIDSLQAKVADIDLLEADVANIETLIFGSATGNVIQTSFSNAVIAQLGDAQIKSAMIENISADKITAGDIITNNVRVMSEDGRLIISDETMQISDENRVRVQIGKDAEGDYSINIWDADGNLMFSEGGITDSAIKEAIIRNDMVSDDANISAYKLDIDSLFTAINEDGSNTIISSRIYLNDEEQTLDVAFKEMTTNVDGLNETVSSQGTQLTVVQGQISSKIWQEDINTAVDNIDIGGRNLAIGSASNYWLSGFNQPATTIAGERDYTVTDETHNSTVVTRWSGSNYNEYSGPFFGIGTVLGITLEVGEIYTVSAWVKADAETSLKSSSFAEGHTLVSYSTNVKTEWTRVWVVFEATKTDGNFRFYTEPNATTDAPYIYMCGIKVEKGNKPTDWTPAPEDTKKDISTLSTQYSTLNQTVNGISATVASHTSLIESKADESTVIEVQDKISEVELSLSGFQTTVSETYATKVEMEDAIDDIAKDLATETEFTELKTQVTQNTSSITAVAERTTTNETSIAQLQLTADGLTSRVSGVEQDAETALVNAANAQEDIDNLEIGGRNLFENSASLDESAFGFYSSPERTVEIVEDTTLPSGTYTAITFNEATTDHVGGPYLHTNFGKYLDKMTEGETYTVSAWIKCSTAKEAGNFRVEFMGDVTSKNVPNLSTEWQRYYVTGVYDSTATGRSDICFYYAGLWTTGDVFYISSPKVEKGNKPTDWTPAPEDVESDIADANETAMDAQNSANNNAERISESESLIQQLSDSISMLVVDENGESLMTQNGDSWVFSMGTYNETLNSVSTNLDSLQQEVGDTQQTLNILNQAVSDLGVLADYIIITTYNEQPCIELGEADSDFKLRITNTEIQFVEGTSTPAYMTNQKLYINKAEVVDEMQMGGFVWKVRPNGNLGLMWKGASS